MSLDLFSQVYIGLKLESSKDGFGYSQKYSVLDSENNDYNNDEFEDDYIDDLSNGGAQIFKDCNFLVHNFSSNSLDKYFITLPDGIKYLNQQKYYSFMMNMYFKDIEETKKKLKKELQPLGLWDESLFGIWYVSDWM